MSKNIKISELIQTSAERLIIISLVLAGFLLRLVFLSSRPPTYDEVFNLVLTKASWQTILNSRVDGFNPPLYFLLLKVWLLFGQKLAFARLLSTILGTTLIFLIWAVGKKIFSPKSGLVAAFLATFSPVFVFESTNLKMYSLGLVESLLVIYFFLRFLETHNYSSLFGLGVFLLLGFYTHYYFVLAAVVVNLVFLINWLVCKKSVNLLKKWLIIQISLLIFSLPLLWSFLNSQSPIFFPAINSLLKLPGVLVTYTASWEAIQILNLFPFRISSFLNLPLFLLTGYLIVAFLGGLRSVKIKRDWLVFFLLYLLLPIGLVFIISFLVRPIFGLRSFILFSPAYYLVVSHGIIKLKKQVLILAIYGFLLLSSSFLIGQYLGFKSTWIHISPYQLVKEKSFPDDIFTHSDPLTLLIARFYVNDNCQFALVPSWYPPTVETAIGYSLISIDKLPTKGNRLWNFLSDEQYFNKRLAQEKQQELEKTYPKINSFEFPNQKLTITLFDLSQRKN